MGSFCGRDKPVAHADVIGAVELAVSILPLAIAVGMGMPRLRILVLSRQSDLFVPQTHSPSFVQGVKGEPVEVDTKARKHYHTAMVVGTSLPF